MINIYYCTDKKLFTQQLLSLISLAKNTKEALNVINLTVEVTEYNAKGKKTDERDTNLFNSILQKYNSESKFTTIDISDLFREHLLSGPNTNNKYYSYYVTVRLLAHLVPEIPDKVIYLDSDTIINGDIKELWDIDISNYEIAGRKDAGRITKYIQSGVMLLNMKLIRQNKVMEKACQLCSNKKYIWYIDMSALNTASKRKKVIPIKYNSYKYTSDCIIHHVCGTRNSKVLFAKEWFHRVKPQEVDLMLHHHPNYKELYDEYLEIVAKYNQKDENDVESTTRLRCFSARC